MLKIKLLERRFFSLPIKMQKKTCEKYFYNNDSACLFPLKKI